MAVVLHSATQSALPSPLHCCYACAVNLKRPAPSQAGPVQSKHQQLQMSQAVHIPQGSGLRHPPAYQQHQSGWCGQWVGEVCTSLSVSVSLNFFVSNCQGSQTINARSVYLSPEQSVKAAKLSTRCHSAVLAPVPALQVAHRTLTVQPPAPPYPQVRSNHACLISGMGGPDFGQHFGPNFRAYIHYFLL